MGLEEDAGQVEEPAAEAKPMQGRLSDPSAEPTTPLSQNSEDVVEDASGSAVNSLDSFGQVSPEKTVLRSVRPPSTSVPQEPQLERKRRKRAVVVAAALVAAGLAAVAAFVTYGMELWGGRSIPEVTGYTQRAATEKLEARGFQVVVEDQPSDKTAGIVLETRPPVGARVAEGSQVILVVAAPHVVPDVVGKPLEEGRKAIEDAGAENVAIEFVSSDDPEGSIVSVCPEAGQAFSSQDTITITVAQAYTVPYVLGMQEAEASKKVTAAGLSPKVAYVRSKKPAGTVVAVNPDQGTKISAGGAVELSVSAYVPEDYRHLLEYFSCPTDKLEQFLGEQGFALSSSQSEGEGYEIVYNAAHATVVFDDQPFSHHYGIPSGESLGHGVDGTFFNGIRLDMDASELSGVTTDDRSAVESVANACGFGNIQDLCTQDDIKAPGGMVPSGAGGMTFACGSGVEGDYTWTVLVWSYDGTRHACATCALSTIYDGRIQGFGGVCDYVATIDLFTE